MLDNCIEGGIESLESLIGDVLEQSKRVHNKVGTVSGVDTGFGDLNDCISGLQNMVMFIYRPDLYGLTSPDGESLERLAEIIIDKQRNGPRCSVSLKWNAESATYEPLVSK